MLRKWLVGVICILHCILPAVESKLCESIEVWNYVTELEQLRGCSVIVGYLHIKLIEKATFLHFENISFPELTEIRGYFLVYRVKGLKSLGQLFPNLSVIRGQTLITDYSFVLYDVTHLQEIGLHNLRTISRGSTKIEKCPNLCYVNSIDWSIIGGPSHHLDAYGVIGENCDACPTHCNGYCWNQEYCQMLEPDNCQPECLACKGPTANDCYVCKSYTDEQRCVPNCPANKVRHSLSGHCVTEKECPTILNGTWWTFQGECVNVCPQRYMQVTEEEGWCMFCGEHCTKVCSGTQVDSKATAQDLRGCTHINGSLSIRIDSKTTADELEENLGMIEDIGGYLKIYRSHPLTSFEFFRKLKVIHGRELENRRHALVVFENQNLQKLWDWANFTIEIKSGTISFHYNPQLCLSEIEKFASITGLSSNYTHIDVSPFSNGDKTACNYIDLKIEVVELTSRTVTLKWEHFTSGTENSALIGYLLYYIEDPSANMTIYDERDECNAGGWDSIFVANTSQKIFNLRPHTQYAYYIKPYTSSTSLSGQSVVKRFVTLSDDPSVPLDLKAISLSYNSVTLTWKPPEHPNGDISFYDIHAYLQEDDSEIIAQRNYCQSPQQLHLKEITEPSVDTSVNITSNTTCCRKKEITISASKFDALCDDANTVTGFGSKYDDCKNYMIWPEERFEVLESSSTLVSSTTVSGLDYHPLLENSNYPSKVIIRRIKDPNSTKYVVEPLRHFTIYVFMLRACNSISPLQCSSPVMVSKRTLKKENADDIPLGLTVEVVELDADVRWIEPQESNAMTVSYHIQHKRTDLEHSQTSSECITRQQFQLAGYMHRMKNFSPGKYSVSVKASSLAGSGKFSPMVEFEILPPSNGLSIAIFIVPVILLIMTLAGVFYYYLYYRKKHVLDNLHLITDVNPDYAGPIYVPDEWELDRDDIEILKSLGQGTFGMVHSGCIKSKNHPCAIKTINETTDVYDKMTFLNEASVMKAFSEAHHVIKLLGVVSKGEPPLVIMELMARGDLKSFLRKSRDSSTSITCAEMYRMAAEIADGMMYLAAKKFVHRDLAARNCMVAADHTVKIGDFGMTRDIYETDYYRKETRGLMPVRWMSPESLADGVFTSDSDVWSYGVVLWEMVTLAEQPYQGLANEQVLQFVIAQGTLERPPECTDLLYDIMEACWKWRPNQRPLFADIVEKLELNVGQNFKLVSFYHSSGGEEYRMNAKNRVFNPPALTVPLDRNKSVHWYRSEDDVSLYSSLEPNFPTPLLCSFQQQRQSKNSPPDDDYR